MTTFSRAVSLGGILPFLIGSSLAETRAKLTQQRLAENAKASWWDVMDTGPFISDTFLGFGPKGEVAVLKGIAINLGDK
ncbi:MAG: hypothetical protein QNL24_13990, partial [Akkermansiaceae bacterium]